MGYELADIFDLNKLSDLMESFYKVTGVSSGLVDCEGNILVRIGWREICTQYHRNNQLSGVMCEESDKYILSGVLNLATERKPYYIHKCKFGLYFAVSPIEIQGNHLANFMFGQFFINEPNKQEFVELAGKYGFSEKGYLAVLDQVPIYNLDRFDSIINHFRQLAEVIGEMGINRLELLEANKREVKEAQDLLRIVFDNVTNIAVQGYNRDGEIVYWNPGSEAIFGWNQGTVLGKTLDKLFLDKKTHREFMGKLEMASQGQPVTPRQLVCKDREGKEKIIYSTLVAIEKGLNKEFITISLDITDLKHYESEITRLDRLDIVAEMAATIGHEVRNPLTTVRGFLQLLSEREASKNNSSYYDLMIQELDRAGGILNEFLSLAKNKPIRKEKVNLNDIVTAMYPLIEANAIMANLNVELVTKRIPKLSLDQKEIRQLLLNLTRNALEAMDNGGHLLIKTYGESDYIVLVVKDNGPGIDPSVLQKLGTPFNTTKSTGTGLGLAVCYSIALRHNAIIEVETGKDGTTFFVKFPRENRK